MPEWLFDFLSGPTIKIAEAIWNSSMRLIIKLVCSTPQKFSTGTWAFVKENLYPWAEGIGLSALNLFFMIAFLKAVSNLHQNITLEMVIEAMIKVVVANVLYLNILNIMTDRVGELVNHLPVEFDFGSIDNAFHLLADRAGEFADQARRRFKDNG